MNEDNLMPYIIAFIVVFLLSIWIQYAIIKGAVSAALKNFMKSEIEPDTFRREMEADNLLIALGADPVKFRKADRELLKQYRIKKHKINHSEQVTKQKLEKLEALEDEIRQLSIEKKK